MRVAHFEQYTVKKKPYGSREMKNIKKIKRFIIKNAADMVNHNDFSSDIKDIRSGMKTLQIASNGLNIVGSKQKCLFGTIGDENRIDFLNQ